MFILSSISSGSEFWSVNYIWKFLILIYENSDPKVFKNMKFFGEISNNWPNDLLGANVCKTLESCW